MNSKIFFAYSIIWVAVSAAIIAGLLITKNASCLWAFLIPTFVSFHNKDNKEKENETDKLI